MTEAQLERAILELAGLLGWRRAHFRPAQLRSGRWATHMSGDTGFPDLVLVRDGRLLFVELKAERGEASPEQVRWLEVLSGVHGIEVCLWRPADWLYGPVKATLSGEAPAPGVGAWRGVARRRAKERPVLVRRRVLG